MKNKYKKLKNLFLIPFYFVYYNLMYIMKSRSSVFLYWFNLGQNFGDSINPLLVSILSSKKVFYIEPKFSCTPYLSAIGSIIEHGNKNTVIWGSGFISSDSELKQMPLKVLAVRGPRSRDRFLKYGVDCPEVYGDPALLLPRVYFPKIEKRYKYGFIPHHSDLDNTWLKNNVENNEELLIIDLTKMDMGEVIEEILSCEKIISSSLHGIITADAYGIPSVWIEFSDKVWGKGFKFLDYFESVGRKEKIPLAITKATSIEDISSLFYEYKIQIDLDKLIKAAPFEISFPQNIEDNPFQALKEIRG